jgi:hypothetical protein
MRRRALTERERASVGPRALKTPGTVEWSWQTLNILKTKWQLRELTVQGFEVVLSELRQYTVWALVPPEKPYGSLDAMLVAEIGVNEAEAKAAIWSRASRRRDTPDPKSNGNPATK